MGLPSIGAGLFGGLTGAALAIGATLTGGTPGAVLIAGAGPTLSQDATKLFWDSTNKRLGIGTDAPSADLTIVGVATNALLVQGGIARFEGGIHSPGSAGSTTFQAGLNANAANSSTCAVGSSAIAQGAFSTAIGSGASCGSGAIAGIAIGPSAVSSHSRSIVLGVSGNTTAANQLVVFFNDTTVSSMYLGNGVVATTPTNTSINATGGSGANKTGAALGLNGGRGTGAGEGGPVTFSTTKAGASSSTLATLVERARFDSLGNFLFNATAPGTSAERVLALGNSNVVAPTTSADLAQLYAVDLSAGNCTLGLFTERAVAADAAVASTHSLSIVINGTTYRLLLAV